jgi:hypothetical protein
MRAVGLAVAVKAIAGAESQETECIVSLTQLAGGAKRRWHGAFREAARAPVPASKQTEGARVRGQWRVHARGAACRDALLHNVRQH